MKKEQEAASQQNKSHSAQVGNHVGSSSSPPVLVENHVPLHAQPLSGSKSLLAKVGLPVGSSDTDKQSSMLASAIAVAGVESAIFGGGQAAMAVRNAPRDGDTSTDPTTSSIDTDVEVRAPAGPTKLPQSMTSPSTTTPKKKDGGGGRRGAGGNIPRLSQLLDPAVIDDHFDQYISGRPLPPSTSSRPSVTASGEFPAFSYDNRPSASNEPPASTRDGRSRAIQRRKTLPGRPPGPLLVGAASSNPGHRAPAPTLTGNRENEAISFVAAAAAATATAPSAVPVHRNPRPPRVPAGSSFGARPTKASGSNRGSMPDVTECASVAATAASPSMPREEVHVLSQLRREELRRIREEAARRHQQDIVLRLGDIKVSTSRYIQPLSYKITECFYFTHVHKICICYKTRQTRLF